MEPSRGESCHPLVSVVTTTDPKTGLLKTLVNGVVRLAIDLNTPFEVIIVDDLKQWPNQASAKHALSNHPLVNITVLWYPEHRGQLRALKTGLDLASGRTIFTIDPDLHATIHAIPDMIDKWRSEHLIIHGYRTHPRTIGITRKAGSFAINAGIRQILGLSVRDLGSPVTLIDANLASRFTPEADDLATFRFLTYSAFPQFVYEFPLPTVESQQKKSHYSFIRLITTAFSLVRKARIAAKTQNTIATRDSENRRSNATPPSPKPDYNKTRNNNSK